MCLYNFELTIKAQEIQSQGNISFENDKVKFAAEDFTYLKQEINNIVQTGGSTGSRKERIVSKGNLNFQFGKVFLSSVDFIYLADEIDLLEKQFKVNLVNSLNGLNTFFRNDGSVVHHSGYNEIITDEQKAGLAFESILAGIRQSQSVESLAATQATDSNGNLLFYQDEEAKNNEDVLNSSISDTGYPMYYKEVLPQNMSVGTAAWVNGKLILGNGKDNSISWENGYRDGYSQGIADSINKANIVYQYHQHEGNKNSVGGCYGNLTGQKPIKCGCNSYSYTQINGQATCSNCIHNHGSAECSYVTGYEDYTYIGLVCGKNKNTIESATIVY